MQQELGMAIDAVGRWNAIAIDKLTKDLDACKVSVGVCHTSIDNQLIDVRKEISELKLEISSLKQTNQDILKKLEEQIQLNSKLCHRIFEMKEEKFKENN